MGYALKFKKKFGPDTGSPAIANDVMAYIPSLRVLKEDVPPLAVPRWGYEGDHAMIVYGLPAQRWAKDVEDLITQAARRLVMQVNASE